MLSITYKGESRNVAVNIGNLVVAPGQTLPIVSATSKRDDWEVEIPLSCGTSLTAVLSREAFVIDDFFQPAPVLLTSQIHAFLNMVSVAEGTSGPDGYRMCFTGKLCVSDNFQDHPRKVYCDDTLCSDAARRYQFLSKTWDSLAEVLGLADFSPPNQDLAAAELLRRRDSIAAVEGGDIVLACQGRGGRAGVAWEWASLPPGRYGQPAISFVRAMELFASFGGHLPSS